jgi:hypothetical protein
MLTPKAKTVSNTRRNFLAVAGTAATAGLLAPTLMAGEGLHLETLASPAADSSTVVHYKTARINDLDIFYREAGPQDAPVILLLHGFPTSSNMFRNLIPRLAGSYHVIAPDYPGYGQSSMPDHKT